MFGPLIPDKLSSAGRPAAYGYILTLYGPIMATHRARTKLALRIHYNFKKSEVPTAGEQYVNI